MRLAASLFCASLLAGQSTDAAKRIRLEGSVLTLTGEAVAKAAVGLVGTGAPPPIETDSQGKFILEDVAPGRYTLTAQKPGFLTQVYGARSAQELWFAGEPTRSGPPSGTVLNLTSGTELKNLTIRLTPQAVIAGKVTDQDGDPMSDAQVMILRYEYVQGRRKLVQAGGSFTDDQGDYRIAGISPGRYYLLSVDRRAQQLAPMQVRIGRAAAENNSPTFYPNAPDAGRATSLDLTPGGDFSGIDIRMNRAKVYSVKGKAVVASTGLPPAGNTLELVAKGLTKSLTR